MRLTCDIALASEGLDPFANLALEEALLGDPLLPRRTLLLYVDRPCVVIGRNQNPWAEVSSSSGLPLARRVSGGGAVYHDEGNLNWSLIVPREEHDRDSELSAVAGALASIGAPVEADGRGALRLAGDGPFAGAKVSGTARRILRDRVLHHGTLLVSSDLGRMAASLGGIAVEGSAAPASVPSRVADLASVAPGLGVGEVRSALALSLAGRGAESAEGRADVGEARRAEERLRSWEWTWGSTPPFSVRILGEASIEVHRGRVSAATGRLGPALEGLVGSHFDAELLARAESLVARYAK